MNVKRKKALLFSARHDVPRSLFSWVHPVHVHTTIWTALLPIQLCAFKGQRFSKGTVWILPAGCYSMVGGKPIKLVHCWQ